MLKPSETLERLRDEERASLTGSGDLSCHWVVVALICSLWIGGCVTPQTSTHAGVNITSRDSSRALPEPTQIKSLNVKVFVDLKTQQHLVSTRHLSHSPYRMLKSPPQASFERSDPTFHQLSAPLQALINELNLLYQPTTLRFKLVEILSWSSEDNGVHDSLVKLSQELNERAQREGDAHTLYLGLVSTSLPSFAQLNDLVWADFASPAVVIRNPSSYYQGVEPTTLQATARLIAYGVARSFGAAPHCGEQGWSGATRDELLGLVMTRDLEFIQSVERVNAPQIASRGQTTQPLTTPAQSDQDSNQPWLFKQLKWSQLSKTFLRHASHELHHRNEGEVAPWSWSPQESCQLFEALKVTCPKRTRLLSNLAYQCFLNEEYLISSYRQGKLEAGQWRDTRESARGLLALREGKHLEAFNICVEIARRQPGLIAGKCAGLAAYQLKRAQAAILYLRAYLSSHPYDVQSSSTLARILGERGADRDVVNLLRPLTKAQRDLGDERGRVYLNLGVGEARLGRWGEARDAWRQIQPHEAEYSRAQELLKQFVDQAPKSVSSH